jgi:hypothetical protein
VLANHVLVKNDGAGQLEAVPYILEQHDVILLDTVGNAAAGDLARSEVLAADTVLIFMSGNGRAEEVHAHAFTLGWRLQAQQHTIFVQSMADDWVRRNRCAGQECV